MEDQPELVCVRRCSGLLTAEVYRSKLEAWGIPVLLRYESAGPVIGITLDGLGEVAILVPAVLADEARSLLEEDAPGDDQETTSPGTGNLSMP
ncbi:MAG TPA: DUF2007 domain-containing protein [Anaerolineae bacterium]|nr:DUF2007 domain-containing protein [Anaerolineae bacterium]